MQLVTKAMEETEVKVVAALLAAVVLAKEVALEVVLALVEWVVGVVVVLGEVADGLEVAVEDDTEDR